VYCSDCHGAVGHGFDPVSGNVICPMAVCIDCHVSRGLDSQLTDCSACHITPHDPVPVMQCSACHQSTDAWQSAEADIHPVDLIGRHAEVQCFDCHQQSDLKYECANCHQPPENHASGDCSTCHTPEGWIESAASQAPPISHDLANRENCVMCHDPAGQVKPAPANHASYGNEQCFTCHGDSAGATPQAPILSHSLNLHAKCTLCHDPAGQVKPASANHAGYTDEQCLTCHSTE
jgi:hypothetical protein